ncbi:DegT/DnrJ/EryC1/StrS family aminotransferase [uncultured Desulfosarcina sp.]|uniref:DegT/DnrJ/EryC1/StrS family aminotransferase n=1 Tax=uncultured Desulfosarcina sp. TaxID=218289 RepID=UPI0029C74191|nr:DegT/DnrJ/EryC1/StrS family aminotransferase [uncultured Desulfosarcina sp.]
MIKFLDLYKQYQSIKQDIDSAIMGVIKDSAFIGGKYLHQFESNFSEYQEVSYCIGVGNGTDALEISIEALELPKESEIIVPANSFIASAEAVSRSGYTVVFCDIRPDDYTICMDDVRRKTSVKTSAIMAVHLYGHPCNMEEILQFAGHNNLKVIEDCAQAHGAEYKGKKVGGIGDIGCFSFYPGKNLGAYGDGGAIVTNNKFLANKARMIANHGRIEKYNHEFEGRNSRLDGLQAAILDVKLKYLDEWTAHRINIADIYLDQLSKVGTITLPVRQRWAKHVYHLFVIRHPKRDVLLSKLKESGIQCGIHYPIALPDLPAYRNISTAENCEFSRKVAKELLSLPIGEHISAKDTERIAELLEILA